MVTWSLVTGPGVRHSVSVRMQQHSRSGFLNGLIFSAGAGTALFYNPRGLCYDPTIWRLLRTPHGTLPTKLPLTAWGLLCPMAQVTVTLWVQPVTPGSLSSSGPTKSCKPSMSLTKQAWALFLSEKYAPSTIWEPKETYCLLCDGLRYGKWEIQQYVL